MLAPDCLRLTLEPPAGGEKRLVPGDHLPLVVEALPAADDNAVCLLTGYGGGWRVAGLVGQAHLAAQLAKDVILSLGAGLNQSSKTVGVFAGLDEALRVLLHLVCQVGWKVRRQIGVAKCRQSLLRTARFFPG